jgi:hypothetical protein
MSSNIEPFRISATDEQPEDLKQRLRATRWTERECVDDWSQGLPLNYAQELCAYWLDKYNWRERKSASIGSHSSGPQSTDSGSILSTCARSIRTHCLW